MSARVAVLGAGPGGYVAAVRAAQLGAEVTLVEQEQVGGTCLNWGCIPSKVMITTAELLEKFHRAQEFGLNVEGSVTVDMHRLMARKARVIQDQAKGILDLLHRHKVQLVRGRGTIQAPGMLAVQGEADSVQHVPWDRLILAPGSRPFEFPGFPFDGERILSSNDALALTEVPRSVLILGGGVIGCEFACLLASLGSRVTLVEALDRLLPLPSVDESCSKVLQREMKKRKITFLLKKTIVGIERTEEGLRITLGPSPLVSGLTEREKQPLAQAVEKLLVCVGRTPNTAGIGLEKIGIEVDPKGWIVADDRMETAAPGVFAIGDVLGSSRIMLAHAASAEGVVAAANALGENRTMSYSAVPGAIFTSPEVADVGLTEAQARASGAELRTDTVLFRTIGKAQVLGEIAGEAKIVSDAESGRILGVHLIGPHATDLIAEGTLAVKMGATLSDLLETIHAHPTLSEVMVGESRG